MAKAATLAGLPAGLPTVLHEIGWLQSAAVAGAGALSFLLGGLAYGLRAHVHIRCGYWQHLGKERPGWDERKRLKLSALLLVDVLISLALLGFGLWLTLNANNVGVLVVSVILSAAIVISTGMTSGLIEAAGLPRGSEAMDMCKEVAWLRDLAKRWGSFPFVLAVDHTIWEVRTATNRVSGFVMVLFALLAAVTAAQVLALAPTIERSKSGSPAKGSVDPHHRHRRDTPSGPSKSAQVADTPTQPTYERLCGGPSTAGEGAQPAQLAAALYRVWSEFGAITAGCADETRLIPRSEDVYYVTGTCEGAFRSLAVAGPEHPAAMLLGQPAQLAHREALEGKLLGASAREPIGHDSSGDFQIVYTTEGSYVAIREEESDGGEPASAADPQSCEEAPPGGSSYVIVPPGLTVLWLDFEHSTGQAAWPARDVSEGAEGVTAYNFYSADDQRTTIASATCATPTDCTLITQGSRIGEPPIVQVSAEQVSRWGPR